jgi:hypothetical protein
VYIGYTPKPKIRPNEKARSGIMSKNVKDHVVLKPNLKNKNSFKFCTSKVFRSLTRGSVDRTLLHKPTLTQYQNYYGSKVFTGYSDTGKGGFGHQFRNGYYQFSSQGYDENSQW